MAGFTLASALCLALYWPGLITWFSMDDFAWLGLRATISSWADLDSVLFSPMAQGTIRPLSERLYFLTLERLFGIEALPFRIVAFSVQMLNVWLVMRLVERMTGSRAGGAVSAVLWIVNSALALALSWSSAFNQILWPCFLLAGCHARWTWLTTGSRRARAAEWVFFVLGFGALELQVVYPAIAGAMTLLYRRERWKDLPPLFGVALAYASLNRYIARPQTSSVYTLYWDGGLWTTFGVYLRMATGIWRPDLVRDPASWWLAAECLAGFGLVAALLWLVWRRERMAAFGVLWFLVTVVPILPLKNHISDYYLTVPVLGLAMAAGVAVARRPLWAMFPALVYCAGSGYSAREAVEYRYDRAERGRILFAGVREAARLHPGKLILLTAVSSEQYWVGMNDNPFRLVPGLRVYLAPGGDENIEKHPELGNPENFVLSGPAARGALNAGQAVVYSPAGGKLRNVTSMWREIAQQRWRGELSPTVDAGQPLLAGQLGTGWHPLEQGFRWSEGRASLRLGALESAREITVDAFRPFEAGKRGKVVLSVRLNGVEAGRWEMESDSSSLNGNAPLPKSLDRTKPVAVELEVTPVLREEGPGGRLLGLAFGRIGLR
ncbi:MAG: hypothetical protein ACKV2U_04730 [Bryobacteraceae bacterium]